MNNQYDLVGRVMGLVFISLSLGVPCVAQEDESGARQAVIDFYTYLASGDIPLEFLPEDSSIAIELKRSYPRGTDSRKILQEFLLKHKELFLHQDQDVNRLARFMLVSPVFKFKRIKLPGSANQAPIDEGFTYGGYVVVAFFAGEASRQAVIPIETDSDKKGGHLIGYDGIRIGSKMLMEHAFEPEETPRAPLAPDGDSGQSPGNR